MLGTTRLRLSLLSAFAAFGFATSPPPSDPVAIYAIIDRVVLTPDDDVPTAIQVYGTFALSAHEPGDHYGPAEKGYLYLSIEPARASVIRAEWADLQRVAGTKQIVGFGAKYTKPVARLRCAAEKVAAPDPYHTGIGVVKAIPIGNTVSSQIERELKSATVPAAKCKA